MVGPQARFFFHERSGGMGVMKTEMKSVPGRTTENFGCHEDFFSEAQIDNRYMSTVSCNSTSKDDDIAACWTCQATAASAVM